MKCGLSYQEALDIPFGELKSYVAIEQIKHEGAEMQRESDFWEMLELR